MWGGQSVALTAGDRPGDKAGANESRLVLRRCGPFFRGRMNYFKTYNISHIRGLISQATRPPCAHPDHTQAVGNKDREIACGKAFARVLEARWTQRLRPRKLSLIAYLSGSWQKFFGANQHQQKSDLLR